MANIGFDIFEHVCATNLNERRIVSLYFWRKRMEKFIHEFCHVNSSYFDTVYNHTRPILLRMHLS